MKQGASAGILLLLAYTAFVSLGLPDGLLGVAWPSLRTHFSVPLDAMGQLLAVSTLGYLVSSFFSGRLVARLGIGGLLAASCALTGLGLIGFTFVSAWSALLLLGIGLGLGGGAIDAGLNIHVSERFGKKTMQWLHACYGIGVTAGPLLMTASLSRLASWKPGYRLVGFFQLLLALSFALSLPLWKKTKTSNPAVSEQNTTAPLRETLSRPRTALSLLLFFVYTGIETSLGFWAYSLLTESRNIPPALAGFWAGGYWGLFTIGRIAAGFFTSRIRTHTLILSSLGLALTASLLLWINPAEIVSLISIVLIGLAAAPVFPALVSGTRNRVGLRHAANTIGLQMTAAGLGIAVLPGLAGVLARRASLEIIPPWLAGLTLLLIACYSVFVFIGKPVEPTLRNA